MRSNSLMTAAEVEMFECIKELTATIKELQAANTAYHAAVHSILQHHPNLDVIAEDFMVRMDNFSAVSNPERLVEVREHWQRILGSMTEELARRKSL